MMMTTATATTTPFLSCYFLPVDRNNGSSNEEKERCFFPSLLLLSRPQTDLLLRPSIQSSCASFFSFSLPFCSGVRLLLMRLSQSGREEEMDFLSLPFSLSPCFDFSSSLSLWNGTEQQHSPPLLSSFLLSSPLSLFLPSSLPAPALVVEEGRDRLEDGGEPG